MNNNKVKITSKIDNLLVTDSVSQNYKESFNTLRTNINHLSDFNKYNKIVVTSSVAAEGKTNIAVNLAITIAETGKKVLLIDADLRNSNLSNYINVNDKKFGLSDILTGSIGFEETVIKLNKLGLDIILPGKSHSNPANLLEDKNMFNFIKMVSSKYDMVIFNSPPVSIYTDAAVLGKYADGVLLVVEHKKTNKKVLKLAKGNLNRSGAKILGVVLNKYDLKNSKKDFGFDFSRI